MAEGKTVNLSIDLAQRLAAFLDDAAGYVPPAMSIEGDYLERTITSRLREIGEADKPAIPPAWRREP